VDNWDSPQAAVLARDASARTHLEERHQTVGGTETEQISRVEVKGNFAATSPHNQQK
jgi:hypothetical protein